MEDPDALDPELPVPRGEEVVAVLEALLYASTQPMSVKKLSILMNGVPEEEVAAGLETLRLRYLENSACGLQLMEVAGGWQAATRAEVADWILRLHKHRKRTALSPSLMETLAIIAYKQPLTRAEIEQIRGVDCGAAMRAIQDAGLAEIVGRKETVGRPPLYGTTDLFLKTFGLKNLEELPSIGELRSVLESPMKTPEEPPPATAQEEAPATPSASESTESP